MDSLLARCCPSCSHSPSNPCRNFVRCRTEGPLCHSSPSCSAARKRRIEEIVSGSRPRVKVAVASCTIAAGALEVLKAVHEVSKELGLEVVKVGCSGLCFLDPWIELSAPGMPPAIFGNVDPSDVEKIIRDYLDGDVSKAYAIRYRTGRARGEDRVPTLDERPEWRLQVRYVSRNCGVVDPESLEHYIALGGYRGLERAFELGPEGVIEEIRRAGLRGRGGAGFPTWLKWKLCRERESDEKFVVANADEGDPGAYMNRLLAESDPFRIVEGLTIAGYAVGASKGYIFVRAEKRLMAERLERAVEEARKWGLLGKNILGTGFSFDIEVVLSGGAFVCGEETALLAAIEGRIPRPRQRPPYPVERGLWGKPTVINNVETLAHVATILAEGWESFAKYGTEKSRGTKMFCVTGSVRRTGAYEVPLGTSIRTLVEVIAGGSDSRIKAVQVGGPSGGCIPYELLDLPLDYESLQSVGAIMGSGGIVVIDESRCMVDVARFFTSFVVAESCGKCVPCRVGTRILQQILDRVVSGEATPEDLEVLEELGEAIKACSLCGLGMTAPNPVLSTLKHFRREYEAHVYERRCPSKTCVRLVRFEIDRSRCIGCGSCQRVCPASAVERRGSTYFIDSSKCVRCGACEVSCPVGAVVRV